MDLFQFLAAKRIPLETFLETIDDGQQQFSLMRSMPGIESLRFTSLQKERHRFRIAMATGAYLSELGDPQNPEFLKIVDGMSADDWAFSIRFHPFHDFVESLDALALIGSAFKNSIIDLHHVAARMSAVSTLDSFHSHDYRTESTKAAGLVLSICSLHSAFIDAMRRISSEVFSQHPAFKKAHRKVIANSLRQHVFLKDLRNCYLHYAIQIPDMSKEIGPGREEFDFFLDGRELLGLGFAWKVPAKSYILGQKDAKIDVFLLFHDILRNIEKQIEFIHRAVNRKLSHESKSYRSILEARQQAVETQKQHMNRALKTNRFWKIKRT